MAKTGKIIANYSFVLWGNVTAMMLQFVLYRLHNEEKNNGVIKVLKSLVSFLYQVISDAYTLPQLWYYYQSFPVLKLYSSSSNNAQLNYRIQHAQHGGDGKCHQGAANLWLPHRIFKASDIQSPKIQNCRDTETQKEWHWGSLRLPVAA